MSAHTKVPVIAIENQVKDFYPDGVTPYRTIATFGEGWAYDNMPEAIANAELFAGVLNSGLLPYLKNLVHCFDGLEGPFSDHKRDLIDIIQKLEGQKK